MTCTLIVPGSTENCISKAFAEKNSFKIHPSYGRVSMASLSQTCIIVGYCLVKLVVEDNIFNNTKLLFIENLCKEVILGYELMNQLEESSTH